MEGHSLGLVIRIFTLKNNLTYRIELLASRIDILLVDLIGQNKYLVVITEPDYVPKSFVGYDLASRIARIDNGQGLDPNEPAGSLIELFL